MNNMNNINPNLWGPSMWKTLHYITISYPNNPTDQDKQNMKTFFQSISNVLPCEKCRAHFAQHLTKYPLTDNVLSSRYNLVNWLINVHNEVNAMNNKRQWTYEQVMDYYAKDHIQDNCIEIATIILLIIIIVVVVYFLYKKIKVN